MTNPCNVEILVVGNEILIGDIQDTNTSWLCNLIHERGGVVNRVTVLPDTLEDIEETVRYAVKREVPILFTSGGLGPTSDDLTLAAVAKGTGRELVLHEKARTMVAQQYDYFYEKGIISIPGLNDAREKMAWLPAGAEPLFNAGGTAPGVKLVHGATTIVSLPGVPSELRTIVSQSLRDEFEEWFGDGTSTTKVITVYCNDESLMEPVLTKVVNDYPDVYTKSLATTLGEHPAIDVMMTMTSGAPEEQAEIVEGACNDLCSGLRRLGFKLHEKGETL